MEKVIRDLIKEIQLQLNVHKKYENISYCDGLEDAITIIEQFLEEEYGKEKDSNTTNVL